MIMYIKCSEDYSADNADMYSEDALRRRKIAEDTTSADLLEVYTYDPDASVRHAVAWNQNTPSDTLAHLVTDTDCSVRSGALRNSNLPATVLDNYFATADIFDAADALHNKNLSSNAIADYYERVTEMTGDLSFDWEDGGVASWWEDYAYGITTNPNTPEYILKEMSEICDEFCFWGLADNPNTPSCALENVAEGSESDGILETIAEHPNATEAVYLKLLDNPYSSSAVYRAILKNPNLSADFLTTMFSIVHKDNESVIRVYFPGVLDHIKRHPNFPKGLNDEE